LRHEGVHTSWLIEEEPKRTPAKAFGERQCCALFKGGVAELSFGPEVSIEHLCGPPWAGLRHRGILHLQCGSGFHPGDSIGVRQLSGDDGPQARIFAEDFRHTQALGRDRRPPPTPRAPEGFGALQCGIVELEKVRKQNAQAAIEFTLFTLAQGRDLLDQMGPIQGVKRLRVPPRRLLLRLA
jgi:hypothetical protein